MKGTHGALIKFDNGHVFIDGIPDACDHDDKESVFFLANGDILFEKNYRCPTTEATMEYIYAVAERRNTTVSDGSVACSKCGKVHALADIMGNAYWD